MTSFIHSDRAQMTRTFIETRWDETLRYQPKDEGTLLNLPFPYTIPCRKGAFQELYYWDTYFTCLGLLESGKTQYAIDNARNQLSLIDRFGFVPNGNRTYYLTRSQPPYLAPLIWQIASTLKDEEFARAAVPQLKREYEFWTTRRLTPTGLSRHGHHASRDELISFFDEMLYRGNLQGKRAEDSLDEVAHLMSECETGWDLDHRFEHRCGDFCPVDLNSTLTIYERFLATFGPESEKATWLEKFSTRKRLINDFLWDESRGSYFDFDHRHQKRGVMITAAAFQPLWTGIASLEQARSVVEKILPQLEFAFGVVPVTPGPRDRVCGWDYPNAWPCIQNLVYRGLAHYGYETEARRIAGKYMLTVAQCLEQTGDLWEKYNALDGSARTPSEHGYNESTLRNFQTASEEAMDSEPPAMMGWTAGVYLDAMAFLRGTAAPLGHLSAC